MSQNKQPATSENTQQESATPEQDRVRRQLLEMIHRNERIRRREMGEGVAGEKP